MSKCKDLICNDIRDKHWVQLPFDSGSSSPWAFFFLVDPGLGAPVGGMRIEINTCYLICNNSRHKMAVQSNTERNSYSSFSDILVFGCLCQLFK